MLYSRQAPYMCSRTIAPDKLIDIYFLKYKEKAFQAIHARKSISSSQPPRASPAAVIPRRTSRSKQRLYMRLMLNRLSPGTSAVE